MVTTVIITKVRMMLKVIKNQDTMMNQGRRMGGIGGGEGMISHFYRTCGFISLL